MICGWYGKCEKDVEVIKHAKGASDEIRKVQRMVQKAHRNSRIKCRKGKLQRDEHKHLPFITDKKLHFH
jgi:hypothetical protein